MGMEYNVNDESVWTGVPREIAYTAFDRCYQGLTIETRQEEAGRGLRRGRAQEKSNGRDGGRTHG